MPAEFLAPLAQAPHKVKIALALFVVLLAAVVFELGSANTPRAIPVHGKLSSQLPAELPGWHSEDRPLADDEATLRQTKALLNFDDALYRVYRQGTDEVGVYMAYWGRGKMPVRDIEAHVPDICWRFAGWTLVSKDTSAGLSLEGARRLPCQQRVFTATGQKAYVAYWHVLEGKVIQDYGVDQAVPWWAVFRDVFRYGLKISGEQYFVRISANRTFEELQRDPGFQALLEATVGVSGGLEPR